MERSGRGFSSGTGFWAPRQPERPAGRLLLQVPRSPQYYLQYVNVDGSKTWKQIARRANFTDGC